MRKIRRTLLAATASAIVLAGFGVGSAQAFVVTGCTGSGRIDVNRVSPASTLTKWTVEGTGTCPIQVNVPGLLSPVEPSSVTFSGAGTSDTLGLCDRTLLVRNLNLLVTVTFKGVVTGNTVTETQRWYAPVTLFPEATPFLISGVNGPPTLGAGIALTRVLLGCGNGGTSPSANFAWAQI